jgi:hypothetical protein
VERPDRVAELTSCRCPSSQTAARFIADSEVLPRSVTTTSVARDGDRLLTTRSQLGANPSTPPFLVTQVNGLR